MCGIAGLLAGRNSAPEWEDVLTRMQLPLRNRGPDDEGMWYDGSAGVGLAHRRLSIIDLSRAGHQPMSSASGRFIMSYNGEVYNFGELRSELESRGFTFRGTSDTEVILAAIERWGVREAVEKFVGMFAFAVWDREARRLTLARDRVGIKPLYYGRIGESIGFASQLSPLKEISRKSLTIDRDALSLLLRDHYISAPHSIYREIRKLPPGNILQIDFASRKVEPLPTPECYWSIVDVARGGRNSRFRGSSQEATDLVEDRLRSAVSDRMVADVPLGAFLSGGIDSSTIVALMQSVSPGQVKTFSIGFREGSVDEAPHARAVAQHLGTEHRELVITPKEAREVIPLLPSLWDEPFADPSQIPTYLVSTLARQNVKVALSGDGGDELFAGYNRYSDGVKLWRKIGWMPRPARHRLGGCLTSLARRSTSEMAFGIGQKLSLGADRGPVAEEAHRVGTLLQSTSPLGAYRAMISHWDVPHEVILGADPQPGHAPRQIGNGTKADFVESMMLLDIQHYLPDDILVKVDRASMAVSLEARVPLLDHRVIEAVWSLPLAFKVRNGSTKWVLRQVLSRHVPRHLFARPKEGFDPPLDDWLRGPLRDWGEGLLDRDRLEAEGYVRPEPIRRVWNQHVEYTADWGERLWPVLMFEAWLEQQGN